MERGTEVNWLPQLEAVGGPKYIAIADAIAEAVAAGSLRPGERLPPQREIAKLLDVDLTTVTRAFGEAQRRGLLDAHVGRGSYVRAAPAGRAGSTTIVDMSMNMPPQPPQAQLQARIADDVAAIMAAPGALTQLHYQDSAGIAAHRHAAAAWLGRRLGPLSPDRLLIASGAQSALSAVLDLALKPGDTLCAGELTYPGLKAAAEHRGFRVEPLAMDEQGIRPDAFEVACRGRSKLLYCVPTIDNPTTATMSLERRRAIADIARKHAVTIVEDDAYGALPPVAPPPIAAIAPEISWHIASLSKCATPALRIAYVVTPGLRETLRLAAEIRATSLMASPLMSALAAHWMSEGTLDHIVASIRTENRARQAIAARLLGDTVAAAPDGHHLWLVLPPHWRRGEFVGQALYSGLSVVPSDAFATTGEPPEAVRVSLGVISDRQQLEQALQQLANLVGRRAAAAPVI